MSVLSVTLLGLGVAGAVGALAARENRSVRGSRRHLLDQCAGVVNGAEMHHGPDGFPWLEGWYHGRRLHLQLIPDTMVLRRLPQLWASMTLLDTLASIPSIAILVRPAGYEFYSLTGALPCTLSLPAEFPEEILVRGSDERAEEMLRLISSPLAAILADPRVKEIAITSKGLRLISQVAEGRRGEHLLLRQAVFDDGRVSPSEFVARLEELESLRSALEQSRWDVAA